MGKWVADFETTSEKRRAYDGTTHVWAAGICEIGNPDNIVILKTLDEFMLWCANPKNNDMLYFHNLRFDGNFILQWLLKNGFEHVTDVKDKKSKTFMTVISDKSMWYEIEVFFEIKGRKVNKVVFRDSLKLIPLSVREIAKSFNLPIKKGSIDYSAHDFLPEGSEIAEEEKEYLVKDIQIVAHALNFFFENGLNKMTIGACALNEFKSMMGEKKFKLFFPLPFYDADVRKAFRGGFTYLEPEFKDKELSNMVVLDVNSLYPSVMYGYANELLPVGTPIFFKGQYEEDRSYPLYVQKIRCSFDIKKNKIPTIQIKDDFYYEGSQYLTTSDYEDVTLYLTSVDLKLFLEQYDVYNIEYISGWKFMAVKANDLFGKFVEKWSDVKIKSKEEGNNGMYLIAKLILNNLFGKFASAINVRTKNPVMDKNGKIHFRLGDYEKKDGVYIAMACFITAYGRDRTIRAAQRIKDDYKNKKSKVQFVYADTDSLHCVSPDFSLPEGLEINKTKIGAWDHEANATRGKFIRQKCYIEEHIISEEKYNKAMEDDDTIKCLYRKDGENYYFTKITVAGMPTSCHENVTFENFKVGASYPGKLAHRTVVGGVVLENINYTIQE